jgi:hypothetical protein
MSHDLLLVIEHRETRVRMDGRALHIDRPEASPERVPLGLLGLVVVHGSPMVSCDPVALELVEGFSASPRSRYSSWAMVRISWLREVTSTATRCGSRPAALAFC